MATRDKGLYPAASDVKFAELFQSASQCANNGGVINGNPVIKNGVGTFDGTGDYIDYNGLESDNLEKGNKTFLFTFNSDDPSVTNVIMYLSDGDTENDYFTVCTYQNKLLASANNTNAASLFSGAIVANTKYRVAITKTAGDVSNIYINGVQSIAGATLYLSAGSKKYIIGGSWYSGAFSDGFCGDISDVRIVDRILTAQECLDDFSNSTFNYC